MSESNKKIAQINALVNGRGLQYLLNEAYKIFGNPALLFNMEYELLAYTENVVADDWCWNEIVSRGVFCKDSIAFFKEEGFIDAAANTKDIAFLTSDKLEYDRYYGRITNSDHRTVVDLIITACYEPFDENTPAAVEALCRKLSKEISANKFYQRYGVTYHETLMRKLMNKDIDDKIIYSDHVANLYEGLKANIYVAVTEVGKCTKAFGDLEDLRDLFKRIQPEFTYAVYDHYLIILMSTDEERLKINVLLNILAAFFKENNLYAGISSRFDNLYKLRTHFDEAVEALTNGLTQAGDHNSFLFYNSTDE